MRPPVTFDPIDSESWGVSSSDTWFGYLKPNSYGVWVYEDGEYVIYRSEELRQIAVKLDELNSCDACRDLVGIPPRNHDDDVQPEDTSG